jgi:hypothetical protein
METNTSNLYTIERYARDLVSKHGYTKAFEQLDQIVNKWVYGTITLSFDHRSVLFKSDRIELVEHGFKGYEYIIQSEYRSSLPILSKWYTTRYEQHTTKGE